MEETENTTLDTSLTPPAEGQVGWLCEGCGSLCYGTEDAIPTPCDFCGSAEIVMVSDPDHHHTV